MAAHPASERSYEEICADLMARHLTGIAERLRGMAEVAEREARNIRTRGGRATYASVAGEVQHEILWGMANLSLDGLTGDAQEADAAAGPPTRVGRPRRNDE